MKIEEIKQKTSEELMENMREMQQKLREIRFGLAAGRVKDVKEGMQVRRTIARVKTVLRERVS